MSDQRTRYSADEHRDERRDVTSRRHPVGTPRRESSFRRSATSDPDANRALFDQRYGQGEYAPNTTGARRLRGARKRRETDNEKGWSEAPRKRRAPRKRKPHPVRNFFLVLIVLLVALYLVVFAPIDRKLAFDEPEASEVSAATTASFPLAPRYVLLLGSDARKGDEVSRTDTMVLVRIDVVANKLTLISIPRDTMVELEGHGTQKINAAYAFDGASGSVKAVADLLDVPVSDVAVIRFDGIATLVDAVGGITVDVPVEVYDPDYTGLSLSAGPQQMDGKTALLFSRVRHGFALGDYQRQIDQQLVLKALVEKMRTLSPVDLAGVASQAGDVIDSSLHCYNLFPIALRMLAGSPTVYQTSLPSTTEMVDGVSYVVVDQQATQQLMAVIDAGGDPADAGVANGLE